MLLLFTTSSVWAQIIPPIIFHRNTELETSAQKVNLALLWEGSGTITANGVTMLNNRFLNTNIPVQNGKVTLSIPANVELINFEVYSSAITKCTITSHNKLRVVEFRIANVGDTKSLTSLTIINCPELIQLNCTGNKMTTLIIGSCPKLEYMYCDDNQLTTLSLNNCTALKHLFCHNNKLTALNITNCTGLKYLTCQNNQLDSLNLSGFSVLDSLNCNNNKISTLNLSGCTNLKSLYAKDQAVSVSLSGSNYKNPLNYFDKAGLPTATIINGTQYAPNDNLPTNLGSVLSFMHPFPSGTSGNSFIGSITLSGYVPPPVTIAVTGVTVTPTALPLTVGQTGTITPNITPANATIKDVNWTTTNENVATVSPLGVVTAISPGTASIIVTTVNSSKTASCTVTVTAPTIVAVTGVTVTPPSLQLTVGGSMGSLTAVVTPSNATDQNVIWSSSDETVAIVSTSGVVAPVSVGSAIITARTVDGNHTAFCMVTVAPSVSNDNIGNTSLTVYPNPTSDAVIVTGLTPGKTIRIYSVTGSLVGTYAAQEEVMTINLNNLSSGMYFLNFEGKTIRVIKN